MPDGSAEKGKPEVVPFMAYLWATVMTGGGAFALVHDSTGWHRWAYVLCLIGGLTGVGECAKRARRARTAGMPQPWLPPALLVAYAAAVLTLVVLAVR
ncbi:hypothetical protein ABZ467_39400 [Streptomyces sp. NPDC005727]|uniref:hypothetical protein n=1 Tax=Streptomyces sp. NPDC005727 TaxID=3157053 RepID=UPI0033FCBA4A